jgi:hypothetical protein
VDNLWGKSGMIDVNVIQIGGNWVGTRGTIVEVLASGMKFGEFVEWNQRDDQRSREIYDRL